MKALTALSKYLGYYAQWKNQCKAYNLKWTTGSESIDALQRFFDSSLTLDSMVSRVKEMIRVLPPAMAGVVRFAYITGLRPAESCEAVRLINSTAARPHYYNQEQQCLEHFRFPDIFLRITKKAYLSYITKEQLSAIGILGCKSPFTWDAIRHACRHRNIHMDMRLCRKIHGSWLHKQGISTEEVDFLQGRVSPSVFGRHYLTPDSTLRQRVLVAVSQLEKEIK
jgi:intergrase/recombinase